MYNIIEREQKLDKYFKIHFPVYILLFVLIATFLISCGNATYTPSRPLVDVVTTIKGIVVKPDKPEVTVGQTFQLSAIITQTNGEILKDGPITWAIANGSLATIDANGVIKAIAAGQTEITATAFGQKANVTIIISNAATAGSSSSSAGTTEITTGSESTTTGTSTAGSKEESLVAKVVIKPANYTVLPAEIVLNTLNETVKFVAEAYDGEGQLLKSAAFTWASTDKTIASVDATEIINESLVKVLKTGTVEITATAGDKTSNKIKVTIPPGTVNVNVSFMLP